MLRPLSDGIPPKRRFEFICNTYIKVARMKHTEGFVPRHGRSRSPCPINAVSRISPTMTGAAACLIDSGLMEPALSMAADEVLARRVAGGGRGDTLHIYRRDRPAVSVGFSRKVREDVDLESCRREGVMALRRMSGGGTIYTDQGVLEYGIASRALANRSVRELFDELCGVIVSTLRRFDLDAAYKPPNDILVDGWKVSGSAQSRKGPAVLQHGTIIVDMDFAKAAAVLPGALAAEGGRGLRFASAPPRLVSSLRALSGRRVEMAEVKRAFIAELEARLGWEFREDGFTREERGAMGRLVEEKYGREEWVLKR
jgi:lipoate-protein ligase A